MPFLPPNQQRQSTKGKFEVENQGANAHSPGKWLIVIVKYSKKWTRLLELVTVLSLVKYCLAVILPGDPDTKRFYARMKIWQSETEVCHGQWVRFVCNLGIGDIARIKSAQEMFVNKIRLEQDPVAFHCLELWYHNRLRASAKTDRVFNATFYAQLPFVMNHV